MPRKPNRPCAYSGCPELTDDYYCDNEQCIMALLVGVIRSERFCYGINDAKDSSQSIVSAVTEVQRVSVEVANEAQNVSASTEEQAATMQEIVQASQSLADMAQKLQNEVSKFRV